MKLLNQENLDDMMHPMRILVFVRRRLMKQDFPSVMNHQSFDNVDVICFVYPNTDMKFDRELAEKTKLTSRDASSSVKFSI